MANNSVDWSQYEEKPEEETPDWSQYAENKPNEPTSATGAFLRSAGRAPFDFAEFLGAPHNKLIYPGFVHEKPGDIQHPLAEFLGASIWPGGALKALGKGGKAISAYNRVKNLGKLGNLSQEAEGAEEAANQAKLDEQKFADALSSKYGKSKLPSLQKSLNEARAKQVSLEQQNPSQTPLAEQSPTNLQNRLPGGTGEQLVPQAQRATQAAEREIGQYLGAGQSHDVIFQNIMNQIIRGNRNQLGSGYNKLEESMSNQNVESPRTHDLTETQAQLRQLISQGGLESPEAKALADQLHQGNQSQNVPASDVLRQFRTADKLSKLATQKAYSRNESLTPEQRGQFLSQAQEYRDHARKLQEFLEQNVDEEFLPRLQNLNQGWRQYASLYKNPLARKIESGMGVSGNDILGQMRGEHPSQQLLQQLTQSHPEALRAALGHSFANQPQRLLNPSQFEQGFINQNPNLEGMVNRLREALHGEEAAQQQATARQAEATRVHRAFEEDVKLEKTKAHAREYAQQIEQLEKVISELERLSANTKATMKEKVAASLRMQKAKTDLERVKKLGKGIGYVLLYEVLDTATKKAIRTIFG